MSVSEVSANVSIHAPVKGAIPKPVDGLRGDAVSIHAPVKGAIEQEIAPGIIVGSFNPRAHEGCASVLRHLLYS